MIHLADQIFALSHVDMHNMYTYEHHMVIMKGYVHNRAHPKRSMIEGYTTEKIIDCYIDYIKDGKPIGVPMSQRHGRLSSKGTKGGNTFNDNSYERVREAHFSIMHQLRIMILNVEQHLQELHQKSQDLEEHWIMKEHKLHFTA